MSDLSPALRLLLDAALRLATCDRLGCALELASDGGPDPVSPYLAAYDLLAETYGEGWDDLTGTAARLALDLVVSGQMREAA